MMTTMIILLTRRKLKYYNLAFSFTDEYFLYKSNTNKYKINNQFKRGVCVFIQGCHIVYKYCFSTYW